MAIQNLFGDIASDLSIKNIIRTLGRFSFDSASSLRISVAGGTLPAVTTVGTVTTVSTMTTGNISIGDSGKPSTIMQNSANVFNNSVGRNFIRN